MYGKNILKLIPAVGLIVSLIFMIPANIAAGAEDIFSDVKTKIGGITEAEKATLQKLFTQSQLIAETEKKAEQTSRDIKKTSEQVESLKKKIEADGTKYENERESLKQVLQSYQRMGPGSYLEILLESDSLKDLLMRINTLRDLTNNTGKLMDRIEADRKLQTQEKTRLSDELESVQDKQRKLTKTLSEENKLKEELERDLESLSTERSKYEDYLGNLQQAWDGIAPLIMATAGEITDYSKKVSIPPDALK
jgi:peptidoglycan hydrolase CwlO-like protein